MRIGIDLKPGLISQETSYSTQGSFRDADNVRFWQGRAEVIGGYSKVATDLLMGMCRTILSWRDNTGRSHIAFGTHSHLLLFRNGQLYDITPAGYTAGNVNGGTGFGFGRGPYGTGPYGEIAGTSVDYGPRIWTLANFGQDLIATPRLGNIYWWQGDTGVAATKVSDIVGANAVPASNNIVLVTKERQVLSFGTNEELSGSYNPLCIRGSDIDGNLQDWHVSFANNAFEDILPSGGSIIGAKIWGDNVAVWTLSGLYSGQFVGDPSQTYRWDAVDGAVGLAGPNAAIVLGQTAYWISPDLQLWACGFGGIPEMVTCPIREDTFSNVATNQQEKIVLSYIASARELRIDYPDSRDGLENSRYVVLNLEEGVWSKGTQSRTAFERGIAFQYPLAVQTFTRDLVHPTAILDLATAQSALDDIVAALGLGSNNVIQSNTTVTAGGGLVANTAITWGSSGWGLKFTGNGSTALQAQVAGLNTTAAGKVSISYKARVAIGGPTNMTVSLYNTATPATVVSTVVNVTTSPQTFRYENITADATTDVVHFDITGLPAGVVVEITDIKVELRSSSSDWSPSRSDSNLFTSYAGWLSTTVYPQIIGEFYFHERGRDADGDALTWSLESNDFAMDEDETCMLVRGFQPDFKDQQGTVSLTVFLRMNPQDVEEVYGPYELDPGQDRMDFMATGKLARFRIEGSSAPAQLRLGRPIFDVVPAGRR